MVFMLYGVFRAKKAELASSFLEWTSDPIHKSLTDVSGLKGEAKKQFKNMLGYCGDRKYQYPDPLIRDIVAKGKFIVALSPPPPPMVMVHQLRHPKHEYAPPLSFSSVLLSRKVC